MQKIVRSGWCKISLIGAVLALLAPDRGIIWAQGIGQSERVTGDARGELALAGTQSETDVIAEVRIVGNHNIPTEQVMRYIRTRAGVDFDQSMIDDDVNRALTSKKFKDIRPETRKVSDGILVTFTIFEWPNTVLEVVYRNAKHISQKDLEEMMPDVRKGLPLNPASNMKACRDIEDFLKAKGRYWAKVTLEEGAKPTDRRVVFNISEGPVVRVRSTRFIGGQELSTSAPVRTQLNISRNFLGFSSIYNQAMVEADVKKLEEYFVANGHRFAKVTHELKFSDDQSLVDIIFHISEGLRTRVQNITISDNPIFSQAEMVSVPQLHRGEYFSDGKAKLDEKSLEAYTGWRGYKAKVQTEVYDSGPGLVTVNYEVAQPPEKSLVANVYVTGNDVTQDRVILHLLGLYPGQTLRYPELKIGEANLARSNLFDIKSEDTRPTDDLISEIAIRGNKYVPLEKILECLSINPGMVFDKTVLSQESKRLLGSNLFLQVSMEHKSTDSGVAVTIHVVEHPVVEEIIFENAFHISDEDLISLVRCCGVARNTKADPVANRKACKAIQAEFAARGYHWAAVTVKENHNSDGRVVFDVKEGPLVHIRSISFVGNKSITAERLRARVDNKMALQGSTGVYQPRLADELDQELEHVYRGNGYCEARVQHAVGFDHGNDEADLTFKIVEGGHFKVKSWRVNTPQAFEVPAELERVITLKSGEFFDENLARKDAGAITECYRKVGCPVTVTVDLSYPMPGFVQVHYTVTPRKSPFGG